MNIQAFCIYEPLGKLFHKRRFLIHFSVPITIQLQYILKYAQRICMSSCVVPILYGFPSVFKLIIVPQKCQYQKNQGMFPKVNLQDMELVIDAKTYTGFFHLYYCYIDCYNLCGDFCLVG